MSATVCTVYCEILEQYLVRILLHILRYNAKSFPTFSVVSLTYRLSHPTVCISVTVTDFRRFSATVHSGGSHCGCFSHAALTLSKKRCVGPSYDTPCVLVNLLTRSSGDITPIRSPHFASYLSPTVLDSLLSVSWSQSHISTLCPCSTMIGGDIIIILSGSLLLFVRPLSARHPATPRMHIVRKS